MLALGLATGLAGCHGGNRRIARGEPGLDPSLGGGTAIASAADPAAPPRGGPEWVDRHPLFSRPRDIYAATPAKNKLVKGAAATVVGVPVGLFGEMRQIVAGRPSAPNHSLAEAPPDDTFSPSVMMGELPTSVSEVPPDSAAMGGPGSIRAR
jgi:hypothetical protein